MLLGTSSEAVRNTPAPIITITTSQQGSSKSFEYFVTHCNHRPRFLSPQSNGIDNHFPAQLEEFASLDKIQIYVTKEN